MFRNSDIAWLRVIDIDVMTVVDSNNLELDRQIGHRNPRKLDCVGKPEQRSTFPHAALGGEIPRSASVREHDCFRPVEKSPIVAR